MRPHNNAVKLSIAGALLALTAAPALAADAPDAALSPAAPAVMANADEPRLYKVAALAQFRTLAIRDEDPANDQSMLYQLRGEGRLSDRLTLGVRVGMTQAFSAEEGESGYRLQDTLASASYRTPVDLGFRELKLRHALGVYIPTSRASQQQDLYVAPQYSLSASLEVVKDLTFTLQPSLQYRWHEYAERAGYRGGMNTQVRYAVRGGLDYQVLDSSTFGNLAVGASAGSTWDQKYASRDAFTSDESDQVYVSENYDWEFHIEYAPVDYLSAGIALEHGGRVLRDGIVNTFLVHRDETELAFTLSGSY
jgi:hypothetical protein